MRGFRVSDLADQVVSVIATEYVMVLFLFCFSSPSVVLKIQNLKSPSGENPELLKFLPFKMDELCKFLIVLDRRYTYNQGGTQQQRPKPPVITAI